jgi:FixJ family two-component response regulator
VFREHADEIVAVLLDYHMPGGTGIDVFAQIQSIRPNIPVIMMSGFVEEEIIGQFLGMGVVGFLQKPFRRAILLDTVRKALDPSAA